MTINTNFKHSELTEIIIQTFHEVYRELGYGFAEVVYRNSLQVALLQKGLEAKTEVPISVRFRGAVVGDFKADLVVNKCVLLELKAADGIVAAHEAQLLNYLRTTSLEVGLILNFGPKPQVRRLIFENSRKQAHTFAAGESL